MRGSSQHKKRHDDIDRMLPWYANGTLDGADRKAVEDHLTQCAQCREEVERCRGLARTMREVGDVAPEPHPVQLARLMRQIDSQASSAAPNSELWSGLRRNLRSFFTSAPVSMRWALALQFVLIALLTVTLLRPRPTVETVADSSAPAEAVAEPAFRTLSNSGASPELANPGAERALLRVVFEPSLSEQAMRETLLELRAEIVGGPSTFGVYTLAVATRGAGSTPVEELLTHLREQAGVRFAQQVRTLDGGS